MDLDDEVCLCFHVTQRKLLAYLRVHELKVASQLSQCAGAGTGCGWCVPYLKRLFQQGLPTNVSAADYAAMRAAYRESGERPAE